MRFGTWGEQVAAEALRARGYRVLDMNYRTREGEIDIVAEIGGTTVVVEVKTRRRGGVLDPHDAVGVLKQLKLRRMAREWLHAHPRRGPLRFDVVSIVAPDEQHVASLEVIADAF